MKAPVFRRRRLAFTLVELLVVLGIIALMGTLLSPALSSAVARANSLKCSTNLHAIGVAASLAAADNNNAYPEINQVANASPPVYDTSVQGFIGVLGAYGINSNVILCPVDQAQGSGAACNNKSYPNPGSSYEWDPIFDDEPVNVPVIYVNPNSNPPVIVPVNSARVRLAMDFQPLHHGRPNVLYGDGHVSNH